MYTHISISTVLFTFFTAMPILGSESSYVVVSLVDKGDPYEMAGRELIKLRSAKGIRATLDDLDALLFKLKQYQPRHVAFVVRPDQVDVNFARQMLNLATRIDDDPFVDFAYGVITGQTPDDAVQLAAAGVHVESKPRKPKLGILGVADPGMLPKSASQEQQLPLRGAMLPLTWATIAADDDNPDQEFVEQALEEFQSKSLIAFAGHGYPDGVIGGPKYQDLCGRDFSGAVVYNIACFTGVTCNWYDNDYQTAKIKLHQVEEDESFCLNMLKTGVAGYVAYACPRPAGPEMFADMLSLATEGITIGEQRRRQANSVLLTHLGQSQTVTGFESLTDGQHISAPTPTDEIVRSMSTGSLLFGDPAAKPFRKIRRAYPVQSQLTKTGNQFRLHVSIEGPLWHWFCSDQLEQANMKIETTIAVPAGGITSVTLEQLPFGDSNPAKKIVAVIESHEGQTLLHVKALFDQPNQAKFMQYQHGVTAAFNIDIDSEAASDRFVQVASVQ